MMLGTFESSKRLFMWCVAWVSTYATETIIVLNAMRTWNLLSYAYVLVTTLCWFLSVIWLQKLLLLCHHCPETTVYKNMKQKAYKARCHTLHKRVEVCAQLHHPCRYQATPQNKRTNTALTHQKTSLSYLACSFPQHGFVWGKSFVCSTNNIHIAIPRLTHCKLYNCKPSIDHFHKWRSICYSFVFMLIRPTGLTLV